MRIPTLVAVAVLVATAASASNLEQTLRGPCDFAVDDPHMVEELCTYQYDGRHHGDADPYCGAKHIHEGIVQRELIVNDPQADTFTGAVVPEDDDHADFYPLFVGDPAPPVIVIQLKVNSPLGPDDPRTPPQLHVMKVVADICQPPPPPPPPGDGTGGSGSAGGGTMPQDPNTFHLFPDGPGEYSVGVVLPREGTPPRPSIAPLPIQPVCHGLCMGGGGNGQIGYAVSASG